MRLLVPCMIALFPPLQLHHVACFFLMSECSVTYSPPWKRRLARAGRRAVLTRSTRVGGDRSLVALILSTRLDIDTFLFSLLSMQALQTS